MNRLDLGEVQCMTIIDLYANLLSQGQVWKKGYTGHTFRTLWDKIWNMEHEEMRLRHFLTLTQIYYLKVKFEKKAETGHNLRTLWYKILKLGAWIDET